MSSVAAAMRKAISHSSRWSRTLPARAVIFKRESLQLVRVEPGFPVDRLDEILADARPGFLVHLHERLLPRLLLLGREGDELRLAGLLHRLEGVLVLLP